ncbi:MAG: alpha/beta hydrolase [Rhodocyclaceae bacterium]|nr:alpha/beta hydrolase [Rhodocyclaceae bacterium]MBX3676523.1 alpha/beta hydrolase [Rhodocyclaceae bacterium]MCB1892306.1 alpha/beta hydrolase [Rhodocyclaceae bacterium]MCW5595261.1 alpha/beta hydrolase [Rhodocyclaceae bacterium]
MRQHTVQCLSPGGLHRMAYVEWGDPKNARVLVCVHGLTRNARDFDFLAKALSQHYRVVCPDVVGRGRSNWLRVKDHYQLPQYVSDMVTLIARLGVDEVHWVGTSMGGLIGMALAAQADTPISRLVLNDVGPVISAVAVKRIGEYVGQMPEFASFKDAEQYIRFVSAPFGKLSDAQWKHLTEHVTRQKAGGGYELVYDPGIAVPFRKEMSDEDVSLWPLYDAIRCPTQVVRGAESDLLSHATCMEMGQRGPKALIAEIPGVGHAPMFLDEAQVAVVSEFLLAK